MMNDPPRCLTCVHWVMPTDDWQFEALKFGKCGAIKQREDIIGPARSIENWDAREAEEERLLSESKAIAVDGSGYYAAINTAPDFGCTLHAERKD